MAERLEYKPFLSSECEILLTARRKLGDRNYDCGRDCRNCPVIIDNRVFPLPEDTSTKKVPQIDSGK